MDTKGEDDIGTLECSEKLPKTADRMRTSFTFMGTLSKPVVWFLESTKRKIREIGANNILEKRKQLFLGDIMSHGKIMSSQSEFYEMFNVGDISEKELRNAIGVYLNTQSLSIFGELVNGTVQKTKRKIVKLPNFISELSDSEKEILVYGIKTKKITQPMLEYLDFDNGETLEGYLKNYGVGDLVTKYFANLLIEVRNVCIK